MLFRSGHSILGWRQVPVDISSIGEKANATRPEIEQILIGRGDARLDNREFEKQLYILRRRMEKAAIAENIAEFYVCSLSCRSVVYKGMFLAEHLSAFYPDLLDERFVSRFAIFHQRYSTNTFPQWKLAQPFRVLAHNGEINTILGNINWMKSHEARLEHDGFGRAIEDLKPIVQPGASDSSALDNVFELLVRGHRNLPMVKTMMIPEASGTNPNVPAEVKQDSFDDLIEDIRYEDMPSNGVYPHANGKGVNIATFRAATLVSIGDGRYWAAMGEPESEDPQYLQGPDGKLFVLDLKRMMPALRRRRPDYFRGG